MDDAGAFIFIVACLILGILWMAAAWHTSGTICGDDMICRVVITLHLGG